MPLSNAETEALKKALSLTESGGIYYEGARVSGGTANRWLLVGVGGMGISTLIRVKHEIMNRMKLPVDGDHKKPPKNIAFLAVDTQQGSLEKASYSDTKFEADEMVYTGAQGSSWTRIIQNMQHDKRNDPKGYASFLPDRLPALPIDSAAGEMRLLGRVGLFNKQEELIRKINIAIGKIGREAGETQICLFAGIGGGTGSGSFIDLAFLLKNILGADGTNCPLSTYLYLPDIQDTVAAGQIGRITNAVAALKELDQIIHLGSNNPGYNRPYVFGNGGPTITFTGNPFDYCYLINKTDFGNRVHNSKDVVGDVAESVFELVADQTAVGDNDDSPNKSGQGAINANAQSFFAGVDNRSQFPATYRYMSTCSNIRRIPFLEINTLVVSDMFEQLSNTVLKNPVTIDSINRDLRLLGFSASITALDPINIINDDSITNIENALQTILGRKAAAGDDLYADTRLIKIGGANGYTANDIWSFQDCFGGDGSPYYATKQAIAAYQIGLNANLGLQVGDGQYIGELEMNLKKFILEKMSDPLYGPVYLADVIGGLSTSLNLIALFSRVKTRCHGAAITARNEADLAIENPDTQTGFKLVFEDVKRSHRKAGRRDLEDYLYYLGQWQDASRTEQMYIYMENFCDAIIRIYTKYYNNILEPLKDAVLTVAEIFADNKRAINAQSEFYKTHPDDHLLIYPLDFVSKYEDIFDYCVDSARNSFLDNLKDHLPDWIGVTISAQSNNAADHEFRADMTKTQIPYCISSFVSDFLNGLYGAVNVETIYKKEYGADFSDSMQDEIIHIYNSAYPLFSGNNVGVGMLQEYAILYIPGSCHDLYTAAKNVENGALAGKIQVIPCEDVSRLSIIKVGEGYPLVMNRNLNNWEKTYERSKQQTTHLSVEWEECFPSPNVETSWELTNYSSGTVHERNERMRKKFMFCYKHGLINIRSTTPLVAEIKLSVSERLRQKTEDYIKNAKLGGTSLMQKEASLTGIFGDIWETGITEDLPGMGRYKRGGDHETDKDLIENIMETTILDSRLCRVIEREYDILCSYIALKESFHTPELYVKALACKLIKAVPRNFHVRLYTDDQLSQYEEIIKDDSAKPQMDDYDYLVYDKFKDMMNNISKGTRTWSHQIIANWDMAIVSEDRSVLSEKMQKMADRFDKSLKIYEEQLARTVDERITDMCEKRIDFYKMCILYVKKLSLGLTDDIDDDNDDDDTDLIDL